MTALAILTLVKRFWPAIPILGLAIALLFVREDDRSKAASLAAAKAQVSSLTEANASLNSSLADVQAERVDNDAIAASVASQLQGNIVAQNTTRTIVEKAIASDPKATNWADEPLPDSLRAALRPGQVGSPSP